MAAFPGRVAAHWSIVFHNNAACARPPSGRLRGPAAPAVGFETAYGMAMGLTGLSIDKSEFLMLTGAVDRTRRNLLQFKAFQAVVYVLLRNAGMAPGQSVQRPPLDDPSPKSGTAMLIDPVLLMM